MVSATAVRHYPHRRPRFVPDGAACARPHERAARGPSTAAVRGRRRGRRAARIHPIRFNCSSARSTASSNPAMSLTPTCGARSGCVSAARNARCSIFADNCSLRGGREEAIEAAGAVPHMKSDRCVAWLGSPKSAPPSGRKRWQPSSSRHAERSAPPPGCSSAGILF